MLNSARHGALATATNKILLSTLCGFATLAICSPTIASHDVTTLYSRSFLVIPRLAAKSTSAALSANGCFFAGADVDLRAYPLLNMVFSVLVAPINGVSEGRRVGCCDNCLPEFGNMFE